MVRRLIAGALFVISVLPTLGQQVVGEATYISFSVPGGQGTYPMSINASMTVTGYYYASPAVTHGFVRDADGTITTFAVEGAIWTEPESINAAGDITGFYELAAGIPQGFLRYADGRIVTFDPAVSPLKLNGPEAQPVSISDFDGIAGNYPYPAAASSAFTRSRDGDLQTISFTKGASYGNVATAIGATGAVVIRPHD